jgi:hypothetical protein
MLRLVLVLALSACLALTGCATTVHGFSLETGNPRSLVGREVQVTYKNGEVRKLEVESADAQSITGRNVDRDRKGTSSQIALAEVQSIEFRLANRETPAGRTATAVLGAFVVAGLLLIGGIFLANCGTDGECRSE